MIFISLLGLFGCPKGKNTAPTTAEGILELHHQKTVLSSEPHDVVHTVITSNIPMANMEISSEIWFIKDVGILTNTQIPNMGLNQDGYLVSQDIAWSTNPVLGSRILEGNDKKTQINAYEESYMTYKDLYSELQYQGIEQVKENSCHKISAKNRASMNVTLYIDTQSYYLIQRDEEAYINGGKISLSSYFDDFRELHGAITPFKFTTNMMNIEQVSTISSVEINPENPPDITLPEDIVEPLKEIEESEE